MNYTWWQVVLHSHYLTYSEYDYISLPEGAVCSLIHKQEPVLQNLREARKHAGGGGGGKTGLFSNFLALVSDYRTSIHCRNSIRSKEIKRMLCFTGRALLVILTMHAVLRKHWLPSSVSG